MALRDGDDDEDGKRINDGNVGLPATMTPNGVVESTGPRKLALDLPPREHERYRMIPRVNEDRSKHCLSLSPYSHHSAAQGCSGGR